LITFKTIKWKNFLSTGNTYTELELDNNPTTLVIGDNGAGKSTFLDALAFALYGKPFRKVSKPQLINSINQKDMKVQLYFNIGQNKYKIIRGAKPSIFEVWVNGKMVNQDASVRDYQEHLEKHILKLSFKAFSQVVVLGSTSFVPFMQLQTMHRREVIEDLLDLQIFSVMSLLLRERVSTNEKELTDIKLSITVLEEKIALTNQHILSLELDNEKRIQDNLLQVTNNTAETQALLGQIDVSTQDINSLKTSIEDATKLKGKYEKLKELRTKLTSQVTDLEGKVKFYETADKCHTCEQEINPEFAEDIACTHNNRIQEKTEGIEQLLIEVQKAEDRLEEISKTQTEIINMQSTISEWNWAVNTLNATSTKLIADNAKLSDFKGSKKQEHANLDKFSDKLLSEEEVKEATVLDRGTLAVVSSILKDSGIKSKIIKQYVPIMNKLVNKYLAAMDFFVQFELDENFNETIRSRFRDDFSYASFSEGEKMRIDLSLLFTWRSIAKIRNSASTNLLIMDEVFDSSLDSTGTEEFLKLLNELTSDTNVYIISHKGDTLIDKFQNIIRFEKVKSFSRIAT